MTDYAQYKHTPTHVSEIPVINGEVKDFQDFTWSQIPDVKMIPTDSIAIDYSYQRILTAKGRNNIKQIIANFNWVYFQPILVSPYTDKSGVSSYVVIDGQHRAIAAFLHPQIKTIPAAIVHADFKDQAKVFWEINTHKVDLSNLEIFWAQYHSGIKWCASVVELIHSAGLEVSKTDPSKVGTPKAVEYSAYLDIYADKIWNPSYIDKMSSSFGYVPVLLALEFVRDWSPDEPQALNSYIVGAFAKFFKRTKAKNYGDDLPLRLAEVYSYDDISTKVREAGARVHESRRPIDITFEDFVVPFFDMIEAKKVA